MPGGDRTGPMGMGPMTGRAAGRCAGSATPGFVNAPGGRGFGGRGGGRGRGRRNRFFATGLTGWQRAATGWPAWTSAAPQGVPPAPETADQEQQTEILKRQADYLASALADVNKRLEELTTEARE
jgi:hypothetical protein